jgi:hypothetical protein
MVIVESEELNPMPVPATRDALLELPFRLKLVAAGTVGPMIWMLEAPVEIVMLLPESTMVPADVARLLPWITFPAFPMFSNGG